jgi:negative regulator of sigma E activity
VQVLVYYAAGTLTATVVTGKWPQTTIPLGVAAGVLLVLLVVVDQWKKRRENKP